MANVSLFEKITFTTDLQGALIKLLKAYKCIRTLTPQSTFQE